MKNHPNSKSSRRQLGRDDVERVDEAFRLSAKLNVIINDGVDAPERRCDMEQLCSQCRDGGVMLKNITGRWTRLKEINLEKGGRRDASRRGRSNSPLLRGKARPTSLAPIKVALNNDELHKQHDNYKAEEDGIEFD